MPYHAWPWYPGLGNRHSGKWQLLAVSAGRKLLLESATRGPFQVSIDPTTDAVDSLLDRSAIASLGTTLMRAA